MKAWLPTLLAVCGCAVFTWQDANGLWFLLPRLPFAFVLILVLVPWRSSERREPRRVIPLLLTVVWMLALPWIPTSEDKAFFLAAESLERGMSVEAVRARMKPFLELGVDYTPPPGMADDYPGVGQEVHVFLTLSGPGDQYCEVFFGPDGLTRVSADYTD
jgi:hypothetical protein